MCNGCVGVREYTAQCYGQQQLVVLRKGKVTLNNNNNNRPRVANNNNNQINATIYHSVCRKRSDPGGRRLHFKGNDSAIKLIRYNLRFMRCANDVMWEVSVCNCTIRYQMGRRRRRRRNNGKLSIVSSLANCWVTWLGSRPQWTVFL